MSTYERHPIAELFPRLEGADYDALVKSMRDHGYDKNHPIVLYEGKILDGLNRSRAAQLVGVKPVYVECSGDPWDFAWRANVIRRHLPPGTRAALATEFFEAKEEWATEANQARSASQKGIPKAEKQRAPQKKGTRSDGAGAARIARAIGVSKSTVETAQRVRREAPELHEKIKRGQMTLGAAQQATNARRPDGKVAIVGLSQDSKFERGVWATILPIKQTCPDTCIYKGQDHGCYAQHHHLAGHVGRLESAAYERGLDAIAITREAAKQIEEAARRLATPLRLNNAGDCKTPEAATILSSACKDWPGPVWGYTHAAAVVPRDAWHPRVSIFASVETLHEAERAMADGYAAALTIAEFPSDHAWVDPETDIRCIPCPAETSRDEEDERKRVKCGKCKLCFHADKRLRQREVIVFALHGPGRNHAAIQLKKKNAEGKIVPIAASPTVEGPAQ